MTKENHDKLEALSTEGKDAYIAAKTRILEGTSLTDEEQSTIYKLLDETAFLMKSEAL